MRPASSFTANERDVISERRYGWEQASCALLAKVFDTSPQVIASISKVSPAAPSRSQAGDRPNDDASNPSPAAPLSASLPESVSAPNREALSGSLFNYLHG